MVWTPATQPRDPLGRFRKTNLVPGEYTYTTHSGIVKKYYVNDMNQLADGSTILHMSAQGKVFGSFKTQNPIERIHIIGHSDMGYMEQMAVAASGETTFGVINHSKAAPPDVFSLNRGHDFQPVDSNLPDGETSFGGRAAQITGRPDGKTYDTLNAQKAEQANLAAFADLDNRVYSADPGDFAEAAVQARHYYEKEFGLSESQAREMPVYVYADKNGDVTVKPAYKPESVPMSELGMQPGDPVPEGFHVNGDNLVAMVPQRSPNTHGGSGSVRLRGRDLTRMTRAMQKDGLKSVDFTVSGGTKVSAKSGKPLQNALHFRADYMNPHSGDDITVWGSIEAKQYGTQPVKARREFTTNEEFQDYTRKVQAVRERAAAPYVDPQSPQAAAKLLRAKYGTNRFYSSDIQMRDGKEGVAFAVNTPGGHARMLSNGNGVCIGKEPADAEGFASMFNNGKSPANRITADNVKVLSDGNFRVRKNGQETFYTPSMSTTRGTRSRNGKLYGYNEAGDFMELPNR